MELMEQGRSWLEEGEAPEAVLEEATALFKAAPDKKSKAAWLVVSAEAYLALGKSEEGLDAASEALALFKELGAKRCEAVAACTIATAHLARQNADDAVAMLSQALAGLQGAADIRLEAVVMHKLSRAHLVQMKDPYSGAQAALSAAQIFRGLGERTAEAASLEAAAESLLLYDPEQALKVAKDAAAICDEIGDHKTRASALQAATAAKAHIATMQHAQKACSMSSRGDNYVPHKWPKPQQQRGAAAPDPFIVQDYQAPAEPVPGLSPAEQKAAHKSNPAFMRKPFKWVAPRHATDAAWYRQEMRFLPPMVYEEE